MDPTLDEIANDLGIADQLGALRTAWSFSEEIIDTARTDISNAVPPGDLDIDVIVHGSFARREASESSDFDYLIVPHSLPSEEQIRTSRLLVEAADKFIEKLERLKDPDGPERSKQPGSSGLFGKIQSAADLVERIGLEQDTNSTHTRRSLLLQESTSVYAPALHEKLVRSMLARYLSDYDDRRKLGPPRFLLTDLNRYWFTVAVDYQAKRWERIGSGWGIRYLKLLISRRLSYVGTVIPLLLCSKENPANIDSLTQALAQPALSRIAAISRTPGFEESEELKTVLLAANEFNAVLADGTQRKRLEKVGPEPQPGDEPIFDQMKQLSEDLETALRRIFTGSVLGEPTSKYLIL
jgi:hypothetical protein